ncbi:MAG TPA: site-2 protease family protein [Vicinamibacterales bacterium]|nr:site-2 protease family protein [Vicinamibacterales bacterium]
MPYPFDVPGRPAPGVPFPFEPLPLPPPRRKFRNRWWLHVVLFLVTLLLTTLVGVLHYHGFVSDFGRAGADFDFSRWLHPSVLATGLWYSLTLLGILGAHEMGHYLFCRRYDVDASLPYFLPAPIPLTGTLGAVIKIREPFPTRTVLFDIGVAGPIAGFLVLVPALFWGLTMSTVVPEPPPQDVFMLGEPLLFQWGVTMVFGTVPAGYTVNIHPMVFAAWFGMLATALNLLPFGQLDGGHITYATMGRWSTPISLATVGTAILLTYNSSSWMFMTIMMLLMLVLLGPRHPKVIYEYEPLAPGRRLIALFALVIFIICFTPVPIDMLME